MISINQKIIYPVFLLILILSGCNLSDSRIKELYENPEIDKYKVHKIALLPMENDADSLHGTYYSTNHFFNILEDEFPDLAMSDIDKMRNYNLYFIPEQIKSLKQKKQLNLNQFFSTEVGYGLRESGYDAVLIGTVKDSTRKVTLVFDYEKLHVLLGKSTRCVITYYLASIKDGSILWHSDVDGECVTYLDDKDYPPLDLAISDAIDVMIDYLPKSVFNKK